MTVIRGVDASAWTREIPEQAWESMSQAGIEFFIPQVWGSGHGGTGANPYLGQHISGALAADIVVLGGYVWPSWKWPEAVAHWEEEVGIPMKLVWLDVEAGAGVHLDQIADIKAQGMIPGIYASRHSWGSIMGADSTFRNEPLWVAHYRRGPWPTAITESGGLPALPDSWNTPRVWQWMGTTTLQDDQYDLNVANKQWVDSLPRAEAPEPIEEEEMSSKEYDELKRRISQQDSRIAGIKGTAGAASNLASSVNSSLDAHIRSHGTATPPAPPTRKTYVVKRGDSASAIAASHNLSLARLKRLNPGKPRSGNWNLIYPGEVFNVS